MLKFDEEAHDVELHGHYEFDTDTIVVSYDSMITPPCSLEISLADSSTRKVLKAKAVPGYDKELYACVRTAVKSRDGTTETPVSMVYRKDLVQHSSATQVRNTSRMTSHTSHHKPDILGGLYVTLVPMRMGLLPIVALSYCHRVLT